MRETHDQVCAREGVFDKAIEMIREAKRLGYHVTTNTTVFKETSVEEIEELCELVTGLGIDGLMVSPGYHYESVKENIFLTRQEIQKKFERVLELSKKYPLSSTPMYLEFAAGKRDYDCSPWSTVTFTPKGWKAPCYLIGEEYIPELERLLEQDRLGLLGVAPGPPLRQLRDALGVRGLRRARAAQEPEGPGAHGRLEPARVNREALVDVLIVAAMPEELAPLRATLADRRRALGSRSSAADLALESGWLGGRRVALAVTGDGARNARAGPPPRCSRRRARVADRDRRGGGALPGPAPRRSGGGRAGSCAATAPRSGRPAPGRRGRGRRGRDRGVVVSAARIADTVAEKRRLLERRLRGDARRDGTEPAVVDLESAASRRRRRRRPPLARPARGQRHRRRGAAGAAQPVPSTTAARFGAGGCWSGSSHSPRRCPACSSCAGACATRPRGWDRPSPP